MSLYTVFGLNLGIKYVQCCPIFFVYQPCPLHHSIGNGPGQAEKISDGVGVGQLFARHPAIQSSAEVHRETGVAKVHIRPAAPFLYAGRGQLAFHLIGYDFDAGRSLRWEA